MKKEDKMKIRKATKKDIRSIAEIFRIESSKSPYNKKRTSKKALEIIMEDFKSNDMYVALVDDKVLGFIMVKQASGVNGELWINELWILKKYQGQGIGKKLMAEIESSYKKKGIKILKLVAHTEKGGALDYYKKLKYDIDKSMVYMQKRI